MEEEVREQPIAEQTEVLQKTNEESVASLIGSQEGEIGRFKSGLALLEAYNSLRAEFTRKCQRLSELEKEKTVENKLSDEQIEEGLSKFLSQNAEAQEYSEELKERVKKDEMDPFESAWANLIKEKITSRDKSNDPFIKKYVFEDEEFKNRVVEIYMKELNSKKPPILLNSESGMRATRQEPVAPNSLKEAKKIVEKMFS